LVGIAFVSFAFGLFIYGWNDVGDVEDDQFNTRKGNFLFGARGTREQLRRLAWVIIAVHIACGAFMTWRYGARVIWWYAALAGATAIYNSPHIGFKRWPVLDLLNQAGYLLVFNIATMINSAPPTHGTTMLFGVSFATHSHLLGEILDLDADKLAGRRTTAVVLGAVKSKLLLTVFLCWEAWLVWNLFAQPIVALAFVAGALWFVVDALWLFGARTYPNWLSRFFLHGWNMVALATMPWVWAHVPFAPR
jgi:4-hydroxybenzoate polyprenyltransferase